MQFDPRSSLQGITHNLTTSHKPRTATIALRREFYHKEYSRTTKTSTANILTLGYSTMLALRLQWRRRMSSYTQDLLGRRRSAKTGGKNHLGDANIKILSSSLIGLFSNSMPVTLFLRTVAVWTRNMTSRCKTQYNPANSPSSALRL